MVKFSIVIPVYNVEKYIKKCLDSVFSQTYKDFEVIVVNDGTKDNSMDIVKNYDVKVINQENMGLSAARNTGVENASGDYLIFLDSDDYWEKDLLKKINDSLNNNPDVVRFQIQDVFEDNIIPFKEEKFDGLNGVEAFNRIVRYHYVENAWCYVIKKDYYLKNKFSFKVGKIHEDFGLIPLIIFKANVVNSIDYIGYNYVKRENSIMSTKNYEKKKKQVEDFYEHYKYIIEETKNLDNNEVIRSYAANSLVIKICELEDKDYKKYKKKLKEDKVYDYILSNNIKRKVKKTMVKISPKMFTKIK